MDFPFLIINYLIDIITNTNNIPKHIDLEVYAHDTNAIVSADDINGLSSNVNVAVKKFND